MQVEKTEQFASKIRGQHLLIKQLQLRKKNPGATFSQIASSRTALRHGMSSFS